MAAPIKKCREASLAGADGGRSPRKPDRAQPWINASADGEAVKKMVSDTASQSGSSLEAATCIARMVSDTEFFHSFGVVILD